MGALKKMKGGKTSCIDGIMVEMLENGGICIIHWLLRTFNKYMESGAVPENWNTACIVPVYKGKGERLF